MSLLEWEIKWITCFSLHICQAKNGFSNPALAIFYFIEWSLGHTYRKLSHKVEKCEIYEKTEGETVVDVKKMMQ